MKSFAIFKNNYKKAEKEPDYKLMAKVGEKFVEIGAAWQEKSAKGTSFLSCLLSKPYQDRVGWELRPEKLDERVNEREQNIRVEDITFKQPTDQGEKDFLEM